MNKFKCRFETLGTEFFFDDGFICEKISFRRAREPRLSDELMPYAAETFASMIDWNDAISNRHAFKWLKELGIERYQMPAVLLSALNGETYKDLVQVSGLRIGLYEIQFGLRIWREDDENGAYTYLSIPLGNSFGFMELRDAKDQFQKVRITWGNGIVKEITV